jgi:lysophospholipase L1-like esterase
VRSTLTIIALLVAGVTALFVVRQRDDGSSDHPAGAVTLIGDSLNVGTEPYLPDELHTWRIVTNDRIGRTTAEGLVELESGHTELAPTLVVSLGTNDPPEEVDGFRSDVAHLLRLAGPDRCVVWATIWRDGRPNDAFNGVLRDAASGNGRLRIVEWAAMVHEHPDWLAADGLHGNATGYRARARAVASAVQSCTPGQTVAEP